MTIDVRFTRTQQKIWALVSERPRNALQLCALVWPGERPASRRLAVHVCKMNKRLRPFGVRIFSGSGCLGRPYRVIKT